MSTGLREEWLVPALQEPISHYTHAVSFGGLVFVSGFIGTDQNGAVVGGDDVEVQTQQALRNLEAALLAAGSDLRCVLKVTLYLTDIRDRERINIARQRLFGPTRPASTLVEVSKLAIDGAKVEIDAIACKAVDAAPDGLVRGGDAVSADGQG